VPDPQRPEDETLWRDGDARVFVYPTSTFTFGDSETVAEHLGRAWSGGFTKIVETPLPQESAPTTKPELRLYRWTAAGDTYAAVARLSLCGDPVGALVFVRFDTKPTVADDLRRTLAAVRPADTATPICQRLAAESATDFVPPDVLK